MLELYASDLPIARVSKILARYNVKASILNGKLQIDGVLSDELFDKICSCITITKMQNFASDSSDEPVQSLAEAEEIQSDDSSQGSSLTEEVLKLVPETTSDVREESPDITLSNEIIYSEPEEKTPQIPERIFNTVKRGEIYLCDFGEPYGSEQGYKRPAIIVQNDIGNTCSNTTIVVPCTTAQKNFQATHLSITQDDTKANLQANTLVLAEQIATVDKARFTEYLGEMSPEFMDKLQDIIDISLGLRRTETIKEIEKRVEVPIRKEVPVEVPVPVGPRNINLNQLMLLKFVDINQLYDVSRMSTSNEEKAKTILELFGFDLNQNGVKLLFKAMLMSVSVPNFTLDILCKKISMQEEVLQADEVKRLIIARFKETLHIKKSCVLDFLRLTTVFLSKQEDFFNEKGNF